MTYQFPTFKDIFPGILGQIMAWITMLMPIQGGPSYQGGGPAYRLFSVDTAQREGAAAKRMQAG